MDHRVQSEVVQELTSGQASNSNALMGTSKPSIRLELISASPRSPVHASTKSEAGGAIDDDGDLDIPRRKRLRRSNDSMTTSDVIKLYCQNSTTWEDAGEQLWRAALLLTEFMLSSKSIRDTTVLEMGCGVGLSALVASRQARVVFATDFATKALKLGVRNARTNTSGDLRFRRFDWTQPLLSAGEDDSFRWTLQDKEDLKDLGIIIAGDVLYDDETATSFILALVQVMKEHPKATAFIGAEQRIVFSVHTLQEMSLGYDTFISILCPHNIQEPSLIETNHLTCSGCFTEDNEVPTELEDIRLKAKEVDVNTIPRYFSYAREKTLHLWQVNAIVTKP